MTGTATRGTIAKSSSSRTGRSIARARRFTSRASSAIAKLLTKFAEGTGAISLTYRMLNGMPAGVAQAPGRPRWARRFVVRVELREDLVSELQLTMATAKLTAVRFDPI